MAVPNIFANVTTSIPLSQLDQNFATAITLGNTAVYLGNTTTTLGNLTLTNANVSSVSTPITPAQGGTGLATLTANNVLIGNGTSNVTFVAPGTNGNALVSNGTTWSSSAVSVTATSLPAGSVIQVVSATFTSSFSTTNTSATKSGTAGQNATITPQFSSSKILVFIIGGTITNDSAGSTANTYFYIFRGNSVVGTGNASNNLQNNNNTASFNAPNSALYYDSPSTTSATTYTIGLSVNSAGQTANFNGQNSQVQIVLMEIRA